MESLTQLRDRRVGGTITGTPLFVAVLSGSLSPEDCDCAFSLGANAYLQKYPPAIKLIELRPRFTARLPQRLRPLHDK